jgi:hypothetical protein
MRQCPLSARGQEQPANCAVITTDTAPVFQHQGNPDMSELYLRQPEVYVGWSTADLKTLSDCAAAERITVRDLASIEAQLADARAAADAGKPVDQLWLRRANNARRLKRETLNRASRPPRPQSASCSTWSRRSSPRLSPAPSPLQASGTPVSRSRGATNDCRPRHQARLRWART